MIDGFPRELLKIKQAISCMVRSYSEIKKKQLSNSKLWGVLRCFLYLSDTIPFCDLVEWMKGTKYIICLGIRLNA